MIISLTYFKGSFDKHALIQVRWYEFARQVLSSRDVEEIMKAFPSRGKADCVMYFGECSDCWFSVCCGVSGR